MHQQNENVMSYFDYTYMLQIVITLHHQKDTFDCDIVQMISI